MTTLSIINSVIPEILASGHKYLDPGSGSFLIQILIAAVAGAGLFLATYWRKVKGFFSRKSSKKQVTPDNQKRKDD